MSCQVIITLRAGNVLESLELFRRIYKIFTKFCFLFNPLNAVLNPICHLPALLGAHHILHVSGIRVKKGFIPKKKKSSKFLC